MFFHEQILSLGILVMSVHPWNGQAETFTPGFYASGERFTVGVFRNSNRKLGTLVSYSVPITDKWEINSGLMTGYSYTYLYPFTSVSYKINNNLKVTFVPPYGTDGGVFAFSVEF